MQNGSSERSYICYHSRMALPNVPSPECIHIFINAADACRLFGAVGIQATCGNNISSQQVHAVITEPSKHLFRKTGWVPETKQPVCLHITDFTDVAVTVQNSEEPPFTETYQVLENPEPQVAVPVDDVSFQLGKLGTLAV